MTDLLLCDAKLDDGNVTVYDMTMGTSQMLSCMEERIHELNSDVEVTCFGQEFNPSTFAIAKADMMIRDVYKRQEQRFLFGNKNSNVIKRVTKRRQ